MKRLTKRSLKKFADNLYEEKGDETYYVPLIRHAVHRNKLHCALGELFFDLVGGDIQPTTTLQCKQLIVSKAKLSESSTPGKLGGRTGAAHRFERSLQARMLHRR